MIQRAVISPVTTATTASPELLLVNIFSQVINGRFSVYWLEDWGFDSDK
jgi:hypothetical protein